MVGCLMRRDVHSRLCQIMQCQDKTFGGMSVVLMGDFVQLTRVGQMELFGCPKVQVGGQDLNDVFGRELFQKFDEVSLVKKHRSTDPEYATSVSAIREWTPTALQTRMEFVDSIVEMTPEEFKDPTWQETTNVSTDQKTVHVVNEVMLRRFAIAQGLPIVAWRLPMVDKYEMKFGHNSNFIYDTVKDMTAYFVPQAPCCLTSNLRPEKGAPEDWRGRLKSLVPKVIAVRYMLKTSYENAHNLLKAMYREWDIDYDMRGHDKRMHGKASKKSPKKGTFPCSKQCGRVFTTTHHGRLHEANCKHNLSNASQEENVQDACIVEPHCSGKRPVDTPSPVARKKQCTGTHTHTRERQEMEEDIIDTVLQPALDEYTCINAATEARTLLNENGPQRLERKGKQHVCDNDILQSGDTVRPHQHRQQHAMQVHLPNPPHCRHSVLYPNVLHVRHPSDHRRRLLLPLHQCIVCLHLGCHATFQPCPDPDWLKLEHYCRSPRTTSPWL